VVDVSSGIRNILAVHWLKNHGGKLMVVMLGLRMSFRYNNVLIRSIVRACEYYLLKSADVVLVNSKFTASLVMEKTGASKPIIVANPGTDISFDFIEDEDSEASSIIRLLFVGECTKVKGLEYLIKAVPLLRNYNVHLDVVGDYSVNDKYYKSLNKFIIDNNIIDKVSFHGFCPSEKLNQFYRRASVFVLPSLYEGYSKTLIEALHFGKPIVSTRVGIAGEILHDNVNAIFVDPQRPDELAEAIKRIIDDNELRNMMIKANLEKVKDLPSWQDFFGILDRELKPMIDKMIE
jgi:glycosyltransferase involved in cell wall biosynthesis